MDKRRTILRSIISDIVNGVKLNSYKVNGDLDKTHRSVYNSLSRMGLNLKVKLSKEKGRGLLWMKKRDE